MSVYCVCVWQKGFLLLCFDHWIIYTRILKHTAHYHTNIHTNTITYTKTHITTLIQNHISYKHPYKHPHAHTHTGLYINTHTTLYIRQTILTQPQQPQTKPNLTNYKPQIHYKSTLQQTNKFIPYKHSSTRPTTNTKKIYIVL